jgi:hypothetical protein
MRAQVAASTSGCKYSAPLVVPLRAGVDERWQSRRLSTDLLWQWGRGISCFADLAAWTWEIRGMDGGDASPGKDRVAGQHVNGSAARGPSVKPSALVSTQVSNDRWRQRRMSADSGRCIAGQEADGTAQRSDG